MDSTLLASIIGATALVLTSAITGGLAVFRERMRAEKDRSDRMEDDLRDTTKSIDKVGDVMSSFEKRLAQIEFNQRLTLERLGRRTEVQD